MAELVLDTAAQTIKRPGIPRGAALLTRWVWSMFKAFYKVFILSTLLAEPQRTTAT